MVRQIFQWIGRERVSIGEVCRRLGQTGEKTRSGKTVWDRTTVWGILKNPAYVGTAAFGKTRTGTMRPRLRAQRGASLQPRRAYSTYDVASEDWIGIPVPALISESLFEAAQEQLGANRLRAREGQRGARYLLQGLVCCALCGYAYYGKAISLKATKGHPRDYAYYRCVGTDAYRFGGHRICDNKQVRTDLLDAAVWNEVRRLLEQPQRLMEEHRRRLEDLGRDQRQDDLATVEAQIRKIRRGVGRLIDSYAEGLIEKGDFEPRITRLRERVAVLEGQAQELSDEASLHSTLLLAIGQLEEFAATVRGNLDSIDWQTQRAIIRSLVKEVKIDQRDVNVVFRISADPDLQHTGTTPLQDCWRRDDTPLRHALVGGSNLPILQHARFQYLP